MESLRDRVIVVLKVFIKENYKNIAIINQLVFDMVNNYKMNALFIRQILVNVKELEELSNIQLFFFVKTISKICNTSPIKIILNELEEFFSIHYGNINEQISLDMEFSYRIGKVMEVSNREWIGFIKPVNFYYLCDQKIINAERCVNKYRATCKDYKIVNKIQQNSIFKIKELIKNEEYIIPQLTFTFSDKSIYNIKDSMLYINKGNLVLIDGYHNYKAIMNLYKRHFLIKSAINIRILEITEQEIAKYLYNNTHINRPVISRV